MLQYITTEALFNANKMDYKKPVYSKSDEYNSCFSAMLKKLIFLE